MRVVAAQLLDVGYTVATLGVGVIVGLAMRCCGARYATVGERIFGLRLVQETSIVQRTE